MKKIVLFLLVTASVAVSYLYLTNKVGHIDVKTNVDEAGKTSLSPGIESVLSKKIELIEELASDAGLISSLKELIVDNNSLSQAEINKLDNEWKSNKGDSDFSKKFLNTSAAKIIKRFQEKNPGFPEIFVTDARGLNAGQTNKTSDYLQSDEVWWTDAYAGGAGKSYHGKIEFDDSSQSRSVALYAPVYGADRKIVGIIKASLDISAIQLEL